MSEITQRVTRLLVEWGAGDHRALDELTPIVYEELRRLAEAYLRRECSGHTLQPTALVHEAYLRLVDQQLPNVRSRAQFYGIAAHVMRQILVDHARRRRAAKRPQGRKVSIGEAMGAVDATPVDFLDLDEALSQLAQIDPRKARMVELRFFTGLTVEETAEALDTSVATAHRELKLAETWLYGRLH